MSTDPEEPYKSAEDVNSDSEKSDFVCSDDDSDVNSNNVSSEEEGEEQGSAVDEQNLVKHLSENYSYRINNFKPLPKETFVEASSFAFEAECQVDVKSEAEMKEWVVQ